MIIYDISWNHLLHLGWKEHPQNERIACKAFTMLYYAGSYQKLSKTSAVLENEIRPHQK